MPPEKRPKVLVFGESLGAWSSSDVVMYQGIKGFDHYGIDRALWFGLPGLAKWSRNGMARGAATSSPRGPSASSTGTSSWPPSTTPPGSGCGRWS